MAGVASFGEASGGELVGVHFEDCQVGVRVVVVLIPVWWGVHCERRCEVD